MPESVTRPDSVVQRECAMCRTMNAPHAGACVACGVSLAREEQEAVRARVTAPRAPRQDAPQVVSVSPAAPLPPLPTPAAAMPPMHVTQGPPLMHAPQPRPSYPNVNWQEPTPARTPQRPGAWHRFLVWTGLR